MNSRDAIQHWLIAALLTALPAALACGQQDQWKQPVYRVSKAQAPAAAKKHPLEPAIELAKVGLRRVESDVKGYTATIVKRERVNGTLNDHEFMFIKVRHEQQQGGQVQTPFSVYMKFLKPAEIAGREVIWIKGRNNDKLVAHEGGTRGRFLPTVWLPPNGMLAMQGQRYPITEIGIQNLVAKLIERATNDMKYDEVDVKFLKGYKVNGRVCTMLQVVHPTKRDHFTFHIARIYIDDEQQLPIRYEAYDWPETAGGRPQLIEEYTYLNLQVNPGLTDKDFDHNNPNYNF